MGPCRGLVPRTKLPAQLGRRTHLNKATHGEPWLGGITV